MKNILILGGCGYIGSALFGYLGQSNRVDTVDLEYFGNYVNQLNIRGDFGNLDKSFLNNYDVVILMAANSSVKMCQDLYEAFDNNVNKFVHLVKHLEGKKFIYASSSSVYISYNNKAAVETDLLNPADGYTFTKTTRDQFMSLTNVEYYGLRFGTVNGYSPNLRTDLMVNAMTLSAIKQKQINLFNGQAHRPLLSINDLCRAVKTIIDSKNDHRGVYNLASVNHTISEIGQKVADYMKVPVVNHGDNYTYNFTIDSSLFRKTFNFVFNGNIESMVQSILDHDIDSSWQKRETL